MTDSKSDVRTQNGLQCPRCREEIYSNSRHDFVECACGAIFIDGGFDYKREGFLPYIKGIPISRTVNVRQLPPFFHTYIKCDDPKCRIRHNARPIWTKEQIDAWNQAHWDTVGKGVTKRREWWETVRGKPGYSKEDIDV